MCEREVWRGEAYAYMNEIKERKVWRGHGKEGEKMNGDIERLVLD